MKLSTSLLAAALALCTLGSSLHAQEAAIRSNLGKRVPLFKNIDEVRKTSIPGIFEIRVNGSEIYYSDASGDHIFQGNLILTKDKELRNLTEERINKLTAVKFDSLPLKDAFTIVRGNGQRKLAVFEDPNCGYCKRFERDLQKVDNVTIYMFLYPILGQDSTDKSKAIWCAKDKAKAWQDWMIKDVQPIAASASCDVSALNRNIEFGKKLKITGTPTLVFADGSRVPGAINAAQIEKMLVEAKN